MANQSPLRDEGVQKSRGARWNMLALKRGKNGAGRGCFQGGGEGGNTVS